jgi:hypothetical protein
MGWAYAAAGGLREYEHGRRPSLKLANLRLGFNGMLRLEPRSSEF